MTKIEDTYAYEDIAFPVSYEDNDIFQDIHKICVMVYKIYDKEYVVNLYRETMNIYWMILYIC